MPLFQCHMLTEHFSVFLLSGFQRFCSLALTSEIQALLSTFIALGLVV